MARDYYDVLGVARTATADEIKKAYRRLARKFHPDVNKAKDAEQKFKEINEAYDVLSDKDKRAAYDQFGHAGVGMGGGAPGRGGRPGPGGTYGPYGPGGARTYTWMNEEGGVGFNLEDLLGEMLGGGRRRAARARREPEKGRDVEHPVNLSFEEAVWGTKLRVQLQKPDERGKMVTETIEIKIPPGVAEGSRVRVRGKGDPGMGGGPPGDLYIVTHIKEHPYYRREDGDIYIDLPLTVGEAVRGAKVTIPTIDGPTVLSVPPGTSSGQKLRLRGKGAPDLKTQKRGDQYVEVKIVVPKKPPEDVGASLDKLDEATGNPRSNLGWPI